MTARPIALSPGFRLARYELLCAVGCGGMASVWAARPAFSGSNHVVAIKMILPQYAHHEQFRALFMNEARIAARISHANVAHVIDVGEEHDLLYMVMEWIEGASLGQMQQRAKEDGGRIPAGIALRILMDVAGGLHAAHELCDDGGNPLGIVHRDVSPENVVIDVDGNAKIIDFGIARARDRSMDEVASGLLQGKLAYMAPEQALKGEADRRADVWSVGAVLYRLLAGKAPYQASHQGATLCMMMSGATPPALPSDVHPAIAAVVARALRHDPEERYATAAELHLALKEAMSEAHVFSTREEVARFVANHMCDRVVVRQAATTDVLRPSRRISVDDSWLMLDESEYEDDEITTELPTVSGVRQRFSVVRWTSGWRRFWNRLVGIGRSA